jgi:hypothetical protein
VSAWPPPPPGFACSGLTHRSTVTAQPVIASTHAQADVRGRLATVHFRAEHGFAFSLEQPDGSPVRAFGYLPLTIGTVAFYVLRARVPHDVVTVCGDSPVSVASEHECLIEYPCDPLPRQGVNSQARNWRSPTLIANFEFAKKGWSIGDSNPGPLACQVRAGAIFASRSACFEIGIRPWRIVRVRTLSG